MKPSLLTIIFLTGSVHSRNFWGFFNQLFGSGAGSEDNKIPDDDENDKRRKPVSNPAHRMENNEIFVNPFTHKILNYTDKRVGWTYSLRSDITTAEGYKAALEELNQYLGNLTQQDHRLHYADYFDDGEGDDQDPFDGGYQWDPDNPPWDPDYSDTEYDYDEYFGYPEHDELK